MSSNDAQLAVAMQDIVSVWLALNTIEVATSGKESAEGQAGCCAATGAMQGNSRQIRQRRVKQAYERTQFEVGVGEIGTVLARPRPEFSGVLGGTEI